MPIKQNFEFKTKPKKTRVNTRARKMRKPIIIQEKFLFQPVRVINLNCSLKDNLQRADENFNVKRSIMLSKEVKPSFESLAYSNKKIIIAERVSPSILSNCSESPSLESFTSEKSDDFNENQSHMEMSKEEEEESEKEFEMEDFTEDDLEFLLHNTDFNEEQINRWHEEFTNKCSTGLITFEQFKAYYTLLLPFNLSDRSKEEIIYKLFKLFDIDGDGFLNFTEFLVSFWIRCKAPIREKFTWIFNMYDLDRNGFLDYEELRNALKLCLNLDDLDELISLITRNTRSTNHLENSNLENEDECTNFLYNLNNQLAERCKQFFQSHQLIEDRINKIIFLLDTLCNKNENSVEFLNTNDYFRSENLIKNSLRRVHIKRTDFVELCAKLKPLRKILLPINYFYEENQLG
jgi:Ca2+-binding EF-hand superfamily protein